MQINLAYGKTGLVIELPDDWNVTIIEPTFVPALTNEMHALSESLKFPIAKPALREFVKPGDTVGIVFNDITRPTPNQTILPAILDELNHVPVENITFFNALGTHRENSEAELSTMLGDTLVNRYRIVQNNAFDPSTQVKIGNTSRGNEVWINRQFMACDKKILTGFIEPHLFAGFSGGGKAVMPGMAGQATVMRNHNAVNIAHPNSTWGRTQGNPIWEEIHEIAHLVGETFIVNVALNKDKNITAVFAGDLDRAHAIGCEFVKKSAMIPVADHFDIVITTNSGYPLDLNLYQSVKGMSAAAQIVRQDGSIIIATECWDGVPEHGLYMQLLHLADTPQELLERITSPGFHEQDQWNAQLQALLQIKASVYVYSDNLSDEQIQYALFLPSRDIRETVRELLDKFGSQAKICVLPEGPQTIPYL